MITYLGIWKELPRPLEEEKAKINFDRENVVSSWDFW